MMVIIMVMILEFMIKMIKVIDEVVAHQENAFQPESRSVDQLFRFLAPVPAFLPVGVNI